MYRSVWVAVSALVVASVAVFGMPAAASAAAPTNPLLGNDVSHPQCASSGSPSFGSHPATAPAFAIVGVNAGVANTTNSCYSAEFAWARTARGGTTQHPVSLYVNTANPGLAASWWPSSNTTQSDAVAVTNPYGTCAHAAGKACAYVYGYSMAHDDALHRGVQNPQNYLWWLDVETANSWSSTDKAANAASLEGMVAYFKHLSGAVGLYATPAHWAQIIGTLPVTSSLTYLPTWVAKGPIDEATARLACGVAGFTPGGRVSVVQFVSGSFDYDISCSTFSSAPVPSITGIQTVGHTLTARTGTWTPGAVALHYQWKRNGVSISGAKSSTYRTVAADGAKSISVTVTGTESGYTTVARTSAAKAVGKVITTAPKPKITGTIKVGKKLTAKVGTWHPSGVKFHYQWKRNGASISHATGKTYTLVAADQGKKITLTVAGTKSGYTTVSKTSSASKTVAKK